MILVTCVPCRESFTWRVDTWICKHPQYFGPASTTINKMRTEDLVYFLCWKKSIKKVRKSLLVSYYRFIVNLDKTKIFMCYYCKIITNNTNLKLQFSWQWSDSLGLSGFAFIYYAVAPLSDDTIINLGLFHEQDINWVQQ